MGTRGRRLALARLVYHWVWWRGHFKPCYRVLRDILHVNSLIGWMFFTKEQLGERPTRLQIAVQYLQKAIETDNTSGASWYLLGRYVTTVCNYSNVLIYVHTGLYHILDQKLYYKTACWLRLLMIILVRLRCWYLQYIYLTWLSGKILLS